MYPPVDVIEKFLEEHKEKPFICCEYTHAMGNSCGGMHKYKDLTDRPSDYNFSGNGIVYGGEREPSPKMQEVQPYDCKKKLTFVDGINNVGVRGENFSAIFAKGSPGMVSYVYAGEEMLKSVPLPNFWRAPVDNDIMKVRSLTWQSIWCHRRMETNVVCVLRRHRWESPVMTAGAQKYIRNICWM